VRRRHQLLADIHHEMELTREEVRLSRESRDDLREFLRETTVRVDRSLTRFERSLAELIHEVRDGREEQRAQTQALLKLIDRMDRLDPGGAAA
jgi:hypothetical protein